MLREARLADIPQLQVIRDAVKENILSNPALVTEDDYIDFLQRRGKGWVYEIEGKIAGFAIVDLQENNVWALFIHPGQEGKGIGRSLHDKMIDWYFTQTSSPIWLGTAPHTRAEKFYRKAGWREVGVHGKGELKFEMKKDEWKGP